MSSRTFKKSAYEAACDILNYAERTVAEIRQKLSDKGYDEEEIDETVARLTEAGFLDDRGYAERYIEYALNKGKGMRRIRDELRRKGIAQFDIEDILFELEEQGRLEAADGKERAMKVAREAIGSAPLDEKMVARVARRLQSRGFEGDEVYYVLGVLRREMRSGRDDEEV